MSRIYYLTNDTMQEWIGNGNPRGESWQDEAIEKTNCCDRHRSRPAGTVLLQTGIFSYRPHPSHNDWRRRLSADKCSSRYRLTKWAKQEFESCQGREAVAG